MFKSSVFGMPQKCPNRNCRAEFFRDSHKGWLPKSELEVYAVMRCPSCRDTFMVAQMINMVHEYKENLPERKLPKNETVIFNDMDKESFRTELFSDDNPLTTLYDGYFPGASTPPDLDVQ
jgi:hypothetical protein